MQQEPPDQDGDQPTLGCLPASFGTKRSRHTFAVTQAPTAEGYPDLEVEVFGSFLEPGADERLTLLSGESSGSSGDAHRAGAARDQLS